MRIDSPDLARRAQRMEACRIEDVARRSAVRTAGTLVRPLRTAARAAGGAVLANEVQVHDGHLNQLVMREPGSYGDVIVGVSGECPQADRAEELEWGSLEENPRAWVRATAAQHGYDVTARWSAELTTELDRRCR